MRHARRTRWLVSLLVFVVLSALTSVVVRVSQAADEARAAEQAQSIRGRAVDRLLAGAEATFYLTHALNAFVVSHAGEPQEWEIRPFLRTLAEEGAFVRSIALAPGNRITSIEPLAGNEAAVGLNYPDQKEQWAAVKDLLEGGTPVLVGPFDLVQGGRGLAYRLPSYVDGKYWGLVSTVLDADAYFANALSVAEASGVRIGLRAVDAGSEDRILAGDPLAFGASTVVEPVEVLGSTWELGTVPAAIDSQSATAIRAAGYSMAIVLAILVFVYMGALQRRREATRLLSELSNQVPGFLFQLRTDKDGSQSMPFISDRVTDVFNVKPQTDGDAAWLWQQFDPADSALAQAEMAHSITTGAPVHVRLHRTEPDGSSRWILAEATAQAESDGGVLWHGFLSDITAEVAAEEQLRVSASVFESTRDAVIISNPAGDAVDVNPAFTALTGFTREEVLGHTLESLAAATTPQAVFDDMRASLARHDFWRGELSTSTRDGRVISQAVAISAVRDQAGHVNHFVTVITGLGNVHDDFITGLPSRQVLQDRLAQGVEHARATGQSAALLVLGLDDFKDVNETLGHRVGDLVLKQAGERLRDLAPHVDTVARSGGDEFSVFLPDHADPALIDDLATRLLHAISQPFAGSTRPIHVTASIGISVFPDDAENETELVAHANQALRVAKSQGKHQAQYFTSSMQADAIARATLIDDLRRALVEDELHVVYQPVVNLKTGKIDKVESLVRWEHPTRGAIGPADFIPAAEKSGLIRAIGDQVFESGIEWLAQARRISPELMLGINMSPVELHDPGSRHDDRLMILSRYGVPGDALIVEITEGLLLDQNETTSVNLARYRAAGALFAIDDFGTGYSSLSYLQQLDVDFVKIDRAFVSGITSKPSDRALCEAIIAMAHGLDLEVIAEGVETREQREALTNLECDYAQGYLFSRPVPGDQLMELLVRETLT